MVTMLRLHLQEPQRAPGRSHFCLLVLSGDSKSIRLLLLTGTLLNQAPASELHSDAWSRCLWVTI